MIINKAIIEKARAHWSKVAKDNGWYKEPFYVQIWVDSKGHHVDSVSFIGLESDVIINTRG